MSHHLVAASDLCFTYPDGHSALEGISFTIHHGESVAIIGGNGAGKSTLLLHLNGVLTPTSGEVRIGDFPITRGNLAEVRRNARKPRRSSAHRRHDLSGRGRPVVHAHRL